MTNTNNVAIALLSNVTAINVRFPHSGGLYTYLTKRSDIEVGDSVVVDTPRAGLTVVTVEKVDVQFDIDAGFDYKFIVDKVETDDYEAVKNTVEEVKQLIADAKREARKAEVLENLGLKSSLLAKINKLDK